MIIRHLLDWWQLRFLDYDEKARAVVSAGSTTCDENYWQAVSIILLHILIVARASNLLNAV